MEKEKRFHWKLGFFRKGTPPKIPLVGETEQLIIKMIEAEEPEEFRPVKTNETNDSQERQDGGES